MCAFSCIFVCRRLKFSTISFLFSATRFIIKRILCCVNVLFPMSAVCVTMHVEFLSSCVRNLGNVKCKLKSFATLSGVYFFLSIFFLLLVPCYRRIQLFYRYGFFSISFMLFVQRLFFFLCASSSI